MFVFVIGFLACSLVRARGNRNWKTELKTQLVPVSSTEFEFKNKSIVSYYDYKVHIFNFSATKSVLKKYFEFGNAR